MPNDIPALSTEIARPGRDLELVKQERALARLAKFTLQAVIAASCVFWAAYWLVSPDPATENKYVETWVGDRTHSRFFRTDGYEGSAFIYQAMPFMVVAMAGFAVIGLRAVIKRKEVEIGSLMPANYVRKWQWSSYPVWIDTSIFGILTAAEAAGILGILFLISYNFGRNVHLSFGRIDAGTIMFHHEPPAIPWQKLDYASYYLGLAAVVPFSLLWIPVSRGSVLLRIAGIPFERAVRYHIWLANLMVLLLTLHSIGYIVYYYYTGQPEKVYEWETRNDSCAVVAGLVAWILSVIIWVTSLDIFRRRFYDLFFTVHHLYLLFSLFWIYHAVWNYHFFVIPMLLFFVDRFLRMVQSRSVVNILSAKVLESGEVELKLPLNPNDNGQGHFSYNALSTWCIQIAGISKQQWHFFSGASSPLDNSNKVSIIIKPLGNWTRALHDEFVGSKKASNSCPFSFKSRVEGPYGDESNFYLKYKTLVLVSGGIGITPLLAILRDILHRYKNIKYNASTCLPTSITVYHCIRKPEELCVLNSVDPNQILPGYDTLGLTIKIHAYITSQNKDDYHKLHAKQIGGLESMNCEMFDISTFRVSHPKSQTLIFRPLVGNGGDGQGTISSIGITGSTFWVACTTIASILGYVILSGLANTLIIKSFTEPGFPNYNRAHIVVACMFLGVVVFGGLVVLMWSQKLKHQRRDTSLVQPRNQSTFNSPSNNDDEFIVDDETCVGLEVKASPWIGDVHLYRRPNWRDVFDDLATQNHGECVGVLVSGSQSMQVDIAKQCKRKSSFHLKSSEPTSMMFHFHSVSFNL